MTKEGIEDFQNYMLAICWICDDNYIDADVEVRDHCYVTANYRGSVHRDYNVNIELYHNIKNYDLHLIMQELGKFNLKISFILNGLENDMSFSINNKLRFIDSLQFRTSLLDSLVKKLSKDDFKYLSQEFDNYLLDLVKQKGFYPY